MKRFLRYWTMVVLACGLTAVKADLYILGDVVYTMAGEPITNGAVAVRGTKISAVGRRDVVPAPNNARVLRAKVVTPGLIDARSVVGLSGILNQAHDQEQLEKSAPIQPELRATDGYNPLDPLVEHVRGFGVTTLHTGHSPGALISGQTMIVKTVGKTIEDALVKPAAMVAASFGESAVSGGDKPPGTKSKAVAMLRAELVKAREYAEKQKKEEDKRPARDLKLEVLVEVLEGKRPLLATVHRHQDIMSVLRLAKEFDLRIVLEGLSDAHLVLPQIKESGFPVILHPTMFRAGEQTENLSFTTAAKLNEAGILFALQSSYEAYVPKTRVVLFEAALAASYGLNRDAALASITRDAAQLLGIADRVGTLEAGKDADLALYDGDPFEYTTHCITVVINGEVVSAEAK